jgi:hypothetical protein
VNWPYDEEDERGDSHERACGTPDDMTLSFIGLPKVEDGKIVEMWVEWDNLAALVQLGHSAPPDPPGEGRAGQ